MHHMVVPVPGELVRTGRCCQCALHSRNVSQSKRGLGERDGDVEMWAGRRSPLGMAEGSVAQARQEGSQHGTQ